MFGGSPHIVAEPPRFAQKISDKISGIGLNFNSFDNSIVTAAKNKITVILSMNIAKTVDKIINVKKIGTTLYFTIFAILIQSHLKNPTLAIPSTITIIPKIKTMVSQLIPVEASALAPPVYQKCCVNMLWIFNVSTMASILRIPIPNTSIIVRRAHTLEIMCLSTISVTINTNIAIKITTAKICANILFYFLSLYFIFHSLKCLPFLLRY